LRPRTYRDRPQRGGPGRIGRRSGRTGRRPGHTAIACGPTRSRSA